MKMTRQQHLLLIAMEECDEVSQRISKGLRFGLDEVQPQQSFTNAERVVREWADLVAVFEMLRDAGTLGFEGSDFDELIDRKKAKIETFLEYSKQCGTLSREVSA